MAPGRLALSLSFVLHIGLGIAFTRAVLSPASPLTKNTPELAHPETPPTYAHKVEDAQQQLQKLAEVANALEELKKERPAPSPPNQQRSDEKAAEQAAKEVTSAQAEAALALKKAQTSTPPDSKALDEARAAQAKAFLAQDKLQQALLRPTEKPQTAPSQSTAEDALKHALERQAAAQTVLKQAQQALEQAEKARTPEAQAHAAEALKAAQAAQQEAGKAQEPVEQKVRVAHYDREQAPAPPGHPGGPKTGKVVASTRVEEKAAAALPKQEQAQEKLKDAKAALEHKDADGAKKALDAVQALQREAATRKNPPSRHSRAMGRLSQGRPAPRKTRFKKRVTPRPKLVNRRLRRKRLSRRELPQKPETLSQRPQQRRRQPRRNKARP